MYAVTPSALRLTQQSAVGVLPLLRHYCHSPLYDFSSFNFLLPPSYSAGTALAVILERMALLL